MCLIALSWQPEQPHPLVLIANRDEFHARPTAPLQFWDDAPDILAGRDLQQGGTWLGVQARRAFAALTNYRQPDAPAGSRSRGHLVADFLRGRTGALEYAREVAQQADRYDGFNLLLGDGRQLVYFGNRAGAEPQVLGPGTYGLSNAELDSPWPKLQAARDGLAEALADEDTSVEQLMALLQRREPFPDEELPDTGVGLSMERMLSPPFICSPVYGTRCTTWMRWDAAGADVIERRFNPAGEVCGEVQRRLNWRQSSSPGSEAQAVSRGNPGKDRRDQ